MFKNIYTIEVTPDIKKKFIETAKKIVKTNSCIDKEIFCSNCVLHYVEGGCIEYVAKVNNITRFDVTYEYAAKTVKIWLKDNENSQLEFDF